jgi:hypothetical protein
MVDKFVFYSKSADVKPGRGKGETVINPKDYTELEKIKDWRKALSNLFQALISRFFISCNSLCITI